MEGIHTTGCRWSPLLPRCPPSDHTYTHTHTILVFVNIPPYKRSLMFLFLSPRLSDDLWCNICRRAAHGVQRALHHRRQTKVTQLQWFSTIWVLTHLQYTQYSESSQNTHRAHEGKAGETNILPLEDFILHYISSVFAFILLWNGCLKVAACVRTSRFSGLMSRWTMFIRCRYLMAPARLNTMALASRSLYFVDEVMASNRSPPWRRQEAWRRVQEEGTETEERKEMHLDELHDQEQLSRRFIHLN